MSFKKNPIKKIHKIALIGLLFTFTVGIILDYLEIASAFLILPFLMPWVVLLLIGLNKKANK